MTSPLIKAVDVRSTFFRPMWRRVLVAAAVLGWAMFELLTGKIGWALLFGVAGLWISYQFFVTFEAGLPDAEDEECDDV